MDRFFAADLPDTLEASSPKPYELNGDEAHHLARVLRAKPGTPIELFNGTGRLADGVVTSVARNSALIELKHIWNVPPPDRSLTLLTSFPKGDRLNFLIEKLCELGVSRVVPLLTERTIVDPGNSKLSRLEKLISSACKQSKRSWLMKIDTPSPLEESLSRFPAQTLVLDPSGKDSLSVIFNPHTDKHLQCFVGPEGGWSSKELQYFEEHSMPLVKLGPSILRIETAAIAAAAVWSSMTCQTNC